MALVAEWKLNNDAGNTAGWLDTSGNGNHLTGVGSPTAAVGHGGGAGLAVGLVSGSNQYLKITDVAQTGLDLSTGFTVSTWVTFNSISVIQGILTKWQTPPQNSYALFWDQTLNKLIFDISVDGENVFTVDGVNTITLDFIPDVGTKYHICVVYDNSSISIYINAVLQANQLLSQTIYDSSGDFQIGKYNRIVGTYPFDGIIDDVRIYNNATDITPAELYALPDDFAGVSTSVQTLTEDNSRTKTILWDSLKTTTEANYHARKMMFGGRRGKR